MTKQGQAASFPMLIREMMQEELSAINQYEKHMMASDIPELNEIWQYIAENEKRHYGMLLEFLRRIDEEQVVRYESVCSMPLVMPLQIQMVPPIVKRNHIELLNYLRNDIGQELRTINQYDMVLGQSKGSPIFQIVAAINQDEKEHVEQLTRVLIQLDTDRYGPLK